jgi:hypothetical protein
MSYLSELPPRFRKPALILSERIAKGGASYEDAVELAKRDCKYPPGANEYNALIERAMT